MQEENPYQSPGETTLANLAGDQSLQQEKFYVASSGRRFANMLLDGVGCFVLLFFVILAFDMVDHLLGSEKWFSTMLFYFGPIIALGLEMGAITVYYVVQEHLWGKTFGKLVTRTMVITTDGGRPSLLQIIGRTLSRFIPLEPLLFIFLGPYPVGLHDKLSNTRVVEDR